MRRLLLAVIGVLASSGVCLHARAQQQSHARFEQYPVTLYHGPLKMPSEFHRSPDGDWVDEGGRPTAQPYVNFAGEYYLAVHSCGTCCRYYTLDNLRRRESVASVNRFDSGDTPPRTKDGHTYVVELSTRPNSRLVRAQYLLDPCEPVETGKCRERYFAFEHGRFRPVSGITNTCTSQERRRK